MSQIHMNFLASNCHVQDAKHLICQIDSDQMRQHLAILMTMAIYDAIEFGRHSSAPAAPEPFADAAPTPAVAPGQRDFSELHGWMARNGVPGGAK